MRGFIDKIGKEVIPLNYYIGAQDFSEGLAAVCGGDYQIYDEKAAGLRTGMIVNGVL